MHFITAASYSYAFLNSQSFNVFLRTTGRTTRTTKIVGRGGKKLDLLPDLYLSFYGLYPKMNC